MKKTVVSFVSVATIAVVVTVSGCGEAEKAATKPGASPTPSGASKDAGKDAAKEAPKHAAHGAGPHGGAVADWGGGKFHVEFTVDHDKQEATVYVLGSDEKTATPVKADKILLTIKDPKFQVDLAAAPLEGEKDGVASRFVGKDKNLGKVQEFEGTISGEADGTPYAGDFKEEPPAAPEKK